MDYNISIPDIYNSNKNDDARFELISRQYKINSNSFELIDLPENTIYMIFRFDNNKIYFENNKIWNNELVFRSRNLSLHSKILCNKSDMDVIIDVDIIKSDILLYIRFTPIVDNMYMYANTYNNITLVNFYSGVRFTDRIFITTSDKITDKIIKLQSFNIISFFKVKLISDNLNYSYELKLTHIKNTFTDDILDIDLNYENIYNICNVYFETLKNIKIFMEKNIKYLNDNNIDIPENLKDSDGWKHNIFYTLYPQNFIKKYNIITYYTHTINK